LKEKGNTISGGVSREGGEEHGGKGGVQKVKKEIGRMSGLKPDGFRRPGRGKESQASKVSFEKKKRRKWEGGGESSSADFLTDSASSVEKQKGLNGIAMFR